MDSLLKLAAGVARLSLGRAARQVSTASGLFMLAMLFLMIGITGFSAALWIAIAKMLGPVSAALIIGGAGFVLAAILIMFAVSTLKSPRPTVSTELEMLLGEVKALHGSHGALTPLIGAALLGFLLAAKGKK